jgi:outer membrane protein OmpA-like peptidoglycan-associated protein
MRPATLVAASAVCATLGAADLGVLSIVVVPRWLSPPTVSDGLKERPQTDRTTIAAAVTRPESAAKPEVAKPEVAKPEVAKPEVAKPEVAEVAKPEVAKPEAAKPEVAKPEVAKPEVAKPKTEPEEMVLELTGPKNTPSATEAPSKPGVVTLRFDLERTDLGSEAHGQLSTLLGAARPADRFRIEGHADASGREDGNRYFSRERAKAVAREMVHMGVAPSRITTSSFGSTRPLVSGRTAAAYERNRRVEVYLERSNR